MAKNGIVNSISRTFHKALFQVKRHSPEILIGVGVVGTVASTVLACKATTKLQAVLDEHKETVEKIHEISENSEEYTQEEVSKTLTIAYTQTGLKVAKLYAPAALLGVASLSCIIGSHVVLRKRNVAIAAAYAALDKGFKDYRGRVIEEFGEEIDKKLRYNLKTEEVEETVVDENGKEKKVKKKVNVLGNDYSIHARVFDAQSVHWTKNAEYNLMFLRAQEHYLNQLLVSRGYLFLNEAYDALGFAPTKAGQVVGWIHDPERGDAYVDLGIINAMSPNVVTDDARSFKAAHEPCTIVDFNIDGVIIDRVNIDEE